MVVCHLLCRSNTILYMVHMENSMIRVLSICILLLFSTTVSAYELLMYSNKHCGYCVKFIKEVVPTYEYKTPSGYMELTIIERGEEPQWFITAYIENRIKPLSTSMSDWIVNIILGVLITLCILVLVQMGYNFLNGVY